MRGDKVIRLGREILLGLSVLFLVACSNTGSTVVYSPESTEDTAMDADAEAERLRLEQERAEELARLAREEEARRMAEEREAARRAEERRLAEEQARREAEETARLEAQRQREMAAARAVEQARMVAEQEARIETLRAQIAANDAETTDLEAANAALREAITAAEALTEALTAEEEKYTNTDPQTGEPLEDLATATLEELANEVETLRGRAEALMPAN